MKRPQPYRIVFENDAIVAVDKAAGIAVLADRWDDSLDHLDELLNARYGAAVAEAAAAGHKPPIPFPHKVFVVHRLDRDTSGLTVFAKTASVHRALSEAFESRQVHKRYIAIVHGCPVWKAESCDLPLHPDGDREHRTIIDKTHGKRCFTAFRVLGSAAHFSVLEALPETGRTHQIRVHLTALGHPLVCDPLYGNGKPILLSSFKRRWRGDPYDERPLIARLGLHAESLILPPATAVPPDSEELRLTAPLAKDMAAFIRQLEKAAGETFAGLTAG